jgi:hypothetical protein
MEREWNSHWLLASWLSDLNADIVLFSNLLGTSGLRGDHITSINVADQVDWQKAVGVALNAADAAIIHARRESDGVRWEFANVKKRQLPTLVLMPAHKAATTHLTSQPGVISTICYGNTTYKSWERGLGVISERFGLPVNPMTVHLRTECPSSEGWRTRTEFVDIVSSRLGLRG